jgi:hypothetical protein
MAVIEINWHPGPKQLRQFAAMLAIVFAGLGAWFLFRRGSAVLVAGLFAGAGIGLVGLIWSRPVRYVYLAWMAAAFPVGWLISHLLLAAIFYLVMTPVGLIMRLVGYDPMQRRFDRSAKSYWQPREPDGDTKRYFKQY